ncbi:4a-hydroxytetrahydrobiopterin dehydratase [Maribellus mangrovi]|uniref:4a-hydroxytetrahydrobiopterin dehydratase n=1 Tax=Maribellus mangrovi TaxID=3133146 RepID=UPI0030EE3A14
MEKLTTQQIQEKLARIHKSWQLKENSICSQFIFTDFTEAFSFMTAVAIMAEKADHHPNWDNTYKKVNIELTTHEAGGLTTKDFELAAKIDKVAKRYL